MTSTRNHDRAETTSRRFANARTVRGRPAPRHGLLGLVAAAAMFSTLFSACDDGATDEEVARAVPCNLADEACAARPAAAEALTLLATMGVDPAEVHAELREAPREPGAEEPAEEYTRIDDLALEMTPEEMKPDWGCGFSDPSAPVVCGCCCFWGDVWGCVCDCH